MSEDSTLPGRRKRAARRKVALPARLRADAAWVDVTMMNVSPRGFMVRTDEPVRIGGYVELRRGIDFNIVGRVVWKRGRDVGVKTQDDIDVDALLQPQGKATRGGRTTDRSTSTATAERSRHVGTMIQYVVVVTMVVAGAITAASTVNVMLRPTFDRIVRALGPDEPVQIEAQMATRNMDDAHGK